MDMKRFNFFFSDVEAKTWLSLSFMGLMSLVQVLCIRNVF